VLPWVDCADEVGDDVAVDKLWFVGGSEGASPDDGPGAVATGELGELSLRQEAAPLEQVDVVAGARVRLEGCEPLVLPLVAWDPAELTAPDALGDVLEATAGELGVVAESGQGDVALDGGLADESGPPIDKLGRADWAAPGAAPEGADFAGLGVSPSPDPAGVGGEVVCVILLRPIK
jgi:hypothetical protein